MRRRAPGNSRKTGAGRAASCATGAEKAAEAAGDARPEVRGPGICVHTTEPHGAQNQSLT